MKQKFLLILFVAVLTACTSTVPSSDVLLSGTSSSSSGMSSQRLEKIDQMLNKAVEDGQIPGAVALIARNGHIVYHKAFGLADVPGDREMKKDDIFRIASQTKAITSTAVMMLWEEGLFRLDDPISKYIPEFKDMGVLDTFNEEDSSFTTVPVTRPITIRHLLTHTSGLGYGMIDPDPRFRKIYQKAGIIDAFTTEPVTIEENIKKLARLPLHFNPGEKFLYCEGLDVLGYFIQIMSGMPLDQFFRERIFDPLDMNDTWFYLPESKSQRLVKVQTKENGQWIHFPVTPYYDPDYPIKGAKKFFSGGGGLSSTAEDYAKFLQMYLNGGIYNGNRILSPTTIRTIMACQNGELWEGARSYYGLAFGVVNQKGQDMGGQGSKGTFNWGGYFNTQYFADPEEQVIGILMKQTQAVEGDETGWKFSQMVFAAVEE